MSFKTHTEHSRLSLHSTVRVIKHDQTHKKQSMAFLSNPIGFVAAQTIIVCGSELRKVTRNLTTQPQKLCETKPKHCTTLPTKHDGLQRNTCITSRVIVSPGPLLQKICHCILVGSTADIIIADRNIDLFIF